MNILITGINGFVGGNLAKEWGQYYTIYGLDIIQTYKVGVDRTFAWDELDEIPKINAVVHLAGKVPDSDDTSDAKSYFDVNMGLTKKIFDWFLQSDTETFVFFSSVKAVADVVHGDKLTEDVVPEVSGPYCESKIKAEEYILSKKSEYERKGKRVYIVRPAMIYGPGDRGKINLLYGIVRLGIPWPLGAYENKRSFCSIDNITFVVEQLIITDRAESGIYHVCDDEVISTNELIEAMYEAIGKKAKIWHMPKIVVDKIAKVGTVLRLPINSFRLQKLTENYVVSNEKVKTALGIDNMPVSTEDGIEKTINGNY